MLNFKLPYATIVGHPQAQYEQDGVLYGADLHPLNPPPTPDIDVSDDDSPAVIFLKNILSKDSLAKSTVYKAAQENNQNWDDVKSAAATMGIVKFQYKSLEMWKLPEDA